MSITIRKPAASRPRYTQVQLEQAFKVVQNPLGWKYPVKWSGKDPGEKNLDCVQEAISHFTGGPSFVTRPTPGTVKITAPGYYICIGS